MSRLKQLIAMLMIIFIMFSNQMCVNAHVEEKTQKIEIDIDDAIDFIYLKDCEINKLENAVIHLSYIEDRSKVLSDNSVNNVSFCRYYIINEMKNINHINNVDELSYYIIISGKKELRNTSTLLSLQNPDGGFGLAKNYEIDILDTKIALKALQVLDETDAMVNAARYVVSNQNKDGGFSYQPGLKSDAELTADIANILADCMNDETTLKREFSSEIAKLRGYLDKNAVALTNLSSDNLERV